MTRATLTITIDSPFAIGSAIATVKLPKPTPERLLVWLGSEDLVVVEMHRSARGARKGK